jgi:hypothetical protein
VEHRRDVTCTVILQDHMAEDDTRAWLDAVEHVAAFTAGAPDAQVVCSGVGTITLHREPLPPGTTLFTGAVQCRNGWHRLGRTLLVFDKDWDSSRKPGGVVEGRWSIGVELDPTERWVFPEG